MVDEFDLLPEEVVWKDEGCELFPVCLSCPLPRCIEEEPRWRQRLKRELKDKMVAEMRQQGKKNQEIAQALGVSERTVRRALRRWRQGK